jgi:hypothetical protein
MQMFAGALCLRGKYLRETISSGQAEGAVF